MVSNEKYVNFLKSIISCISHGDYLAVKELSHLELEKMAKEEIRTKEDIIKIKKSIKISKINDRPLEKWESKELKKIIEGYSEYILNIIEKNDNIKEVQKKAISIKEFIEKI